MDDVGERLDSDFVERRVDDVGERKYLSFYKSIINM